MSFVDAAHFVWAPFLDTCERDGVVVEVNGELTETRVVKVKNREPVGIVISI